ncbi:hypothetical protein BGX29_001847 [Mortierella sp. GBA35]|nr:hypothetical protein BGX29_001847 [Mortierella sp. GBA35]
MALTYLTYSPAVHEAADYLMAKLKSRIRRRQQQHQQRQGSEAGAGTAPPVMMLLTRLISLGSGCRYMCDEATLFFSSTAGKIDDSWMGSLVKEAVESVFGSVNSLDISGQAPSPARAEADDPSQDNLNPASPSSIPIPKFGFYMSTDESSPQILDYFHSLGAILFEDLLEAAFESRFAHLIAFDDWIGLVEQLICARAQMFYGTMSSSFTSGILNPRLDPEVGEEQIPGEAFGYLYRPGGPVLTAEQQEQGEESSDGGHDGGDYADGAF